MQSSEGWGGASARAVDGNSNPQYGGDSCTHTNGKPAWWQVDLGQSVNVKTVVVVHRGDCCGDRLNTAKIYIGDKDGGTLKSAAELAALKKMTLCGTIKDDKKMDPPAHTEYINCAKVTAGRYVNIFLEGGTSGGQHMTLCEIMVYADKDTYTDGKDKCASGKKKAAPPPAGFNARMEMIPWLVSKNSIDKAADDTSCGIKVAALDFKADVQPKANTKTGTVTWVPYRFNFRGGNSGCGGCNGGWGVDLECHYAGGASAGHDKAMAYAATYIKADKIRVVTLKTGSDDGHMTYLNGKLVIDLRNGCRCYGSGQDKATVTLSPGWNTLIAKVGENGGNFGYVAGFDKVDGLCASLDPTKGCGYIGLPVVSNLKTQSKVTYKIKNGIKKGDKYYVDKDFVFTQLPYYLQGVTAIQTAQADVGSSTEVKNFVCFNVDQPATVYILYDKRTDDNDKPGWLKTDFKDKHNSVAEHTDKGMGSFQIFYTQVKKGQTCLGGNKAPKAASMYMVLVGPAGMGINDPKAASKWSTIPGPGFNRRWEIYPWLVSDSSIDQPDGCGLTDAKWDLGSGLANAKAGKTMFTAYPKKSAADLLPPLGFNAYGDIVPFLILDTSSPKVRSGAAAGGAWRSSWRLKADDGSAGAGPAMEPASARPVCWKSLRGFGRSLILLAEQVGHSYLRPLVPDHYAQLQSINFGPVIMTAVTRARAELLAPDGLVLHF